MKKKIRKPKCVHDDYKAMLDIFADHLLKMEAKVWKRCMLEGCRYGYEPVDKTPKDNCIYCGEPRDYYFDERGPVKSIKEYLKKNKGE